MTIELSSLLIEIMCSVVGTNAIIVVIMVVQWMLLKINIALNQ